MGKKLTASQVARYECDGLLSPVDAFSPEQARHYHDCLEAFENGEGRELRPSERFTPRLSPASARQTARRRSATRPPDMSTRFWLALIGLVLSVLAGGCTDSGTASDNDKHGVFYGGVSAGGTRP